MIREDFLQQNAYHEVDTFCPLRKQYRMLKIILKFHDYALSALEGGMTQEEISRLDVVDSIAKMKYVPNETFDKEFDRIEKNIEESLGG